MQIIADLHLHSKFSRAVSQKMDLIGIAEMAARKGIDLVTTGDWMHPIWFKSIQNELSEDSSGIYRLKNVGARRDAPATKIKFLLTTEISSIYTQGGQMRRVHNLIFSPSIATCEKVNNALRSRGANLMSDGRPIVGISSKDLLSMVLEIDKNILFVPAHVWTPWFAMYGSKSGFNSIEESFGEYAKYIYGVETGLSSDPIMNWQVKDLDNRSILSFSDAHSGPKLGREATVFTENSDFRFPISKLTYIDVAEAIKQNPQGKLKIGYTIEFFPEEGKYHWSGHRSCNIRYNPQEVKEKGVLCPVCRRPLTIGVENRVMDLSDRILTKNDLLFVQNSNGLSFVYDKEKKRRPFVSLIPLLEALTEINKGSAVKAFREYERLTSEFGNEFDILMRKSYEEIGKAGGEELAQAVKIIRERKAYVDPGYDGVFGAVKIFKDTVAKEKKTQSKDEMKKDEDQPTLF